VQALLAKGGCVTEDAVAKAHQMEYHELKNNRNNCPKIGDTA